MHTRPHKRADAVALASATHCPARTSISEWERAAAAWGDTTEENAPIVYDHSSVPLSADSARSFPSLLAKYTLLAAALVTAGVGKP